jgi:hypothetical protein
MGKLTMVVIVGACLVIAGCGFESGDGTGIPCADVVEYVLSGETIEVYNYDVFDDTDADCPLEYSAYWRRGQTGPCNVCYNVGALFINECDGSGWYLGNKSIEADRLIKYID